MTGLNIRGRVGGGAAPSICKQNDLHNTSSLYYYYYFFFFFDARLLRCNLASLKNDLVMRRVSRHLWPALTTQPGPEPLQSRKLLLLLLLLLLDEAYYY